jgi:hypothetical protein
MTKNNQVTTPNPIAPTLEIPEEAPRPGFDLANPDLSIVDIFPENFFSLEGLQSILDLTGSHSVALTVTACNMEYVYDPTAKAAGEWRPVLSFEDTDTRLVLNKTRAKVAQDLTGSPFIKDWAKLGQVAIRPGIKDSHAQIILEPLKKNRSNGNGRSPVDDINNELFPD